jgi:glycosyltransferase involved in cell wall biosynthesis
LNVGGALRFVTDTTRPEPHVAASAVCVLSTYTEGLSNAILEYMALAKPVVATACTGNAAIVGDGETGYLVAPGSPESLAARIVELLSNRDRAIAMGARGRALIEERFSLDHMIAAYERLYDRLGAGR